MFLFSFFLIISHVSLACKVQMFFPDCTLFRQLLQILKASNKKEDGIMRMKIGEWLRFDEGVTEFELLETETGHPKTVRGGWPKEHTSVPVDPPVPTSSSVDENEKRLRRDYRTDINPDVLLRRFLLGGKVDCLVACINGMADSKTVNDFILRQGMRPSCMDEAPDGEGRAQFVKENIIALQEATLTTVWSDVLTAVTEGRTAIFVDGDENAVLVETRGFEKRGIGEAQNEKVVRGPQEGFTEAIRTNVTLVRRIVKTDDLVCEFRPCGGKNNTLQVIAYREGVANRSLVNEVKRRLALVDTRMVLSDGTIEQLTDLHNKSPLPQVLTTERPDRAAAHIMQGHVAVLLEGSPFANVMPATIFTLMASPEDSYLKEPLGSILRFVRYLGAALSILLRACNASSRDDVYRGTVHTRWR